MSLQRINIDAAPVRIVVSGARGPASEDGGSVPAWVTAITSMSVVDDQLVIVFDGFTYTANLILQPS